MNRKSNDGLRSEKRPLSFADLHHEITKSEEEDSFKSYGNQQKQATYGRASAEDELVKHMSNLPCYLERGEKIPDKALNVGVLDWASLEQWQHGHKHVAHSSIGISTSTRNTHSSSVPTEGLSGNSSRVLNCSTSHQRVFRPPVQSHIMAAPMQVNSVAVKTSEGSVGKFQNLRGSRNNIEAQSKYAQSGHHLFRNHPTSVLKGCDRRHLNPNIIKESNILPNDRMHEAASCSKFDMSARGGGLEKKMESLREPNLDTDDIRKSKPVVLVFPADNSQNNHCASSDMGTSLVQKLGSPSRNRFSEKTKEHSNRYPNCDISCSYPLHDQPIRSHTRPKGSGSSSTDSESTKIPTSTLSAPLLARMGISPSRSRKADEKKHAIAVCSSTNGLPMARMGISPCRSRKAEEKKHDMAACSSANGPPKGLDQKVTTEKSRSSSPFRRFNFSIGFTSKGPGCKEVAYVPHQSSTEALKSSSENVRGYASSKSSGHDKPGDVGKGRSSPLRRLLDPLLKAKVANCHHSLVSSQKDSVSINKNCGPGNEKFSTVQLEKESDRDQRVSSTTIDTADLSKDKKYVPSTFQALLRIAVKNGQPLFTFAVDNNSDILAATVKNLPVSRKDDCKFIYTIFTFREAKKKNGGWMNQASKSKGPDYIHHVVAQMMVSDSHHYESTSQNCLESSTRKQFTLFSVKLKQGGDAQVTDYQPNDELAAIVVKSSRAINLKNFAHQSSSQNDNQNNLQVTVVLPGGVHSLPSNGGPSSLIERWKTGGSCDCGGWDLACKLKILANENQASRKPKSSKACFADQFELFLQGNDQDQENQPAFCFSHFKPGVYSVAFDSSLSLLQAFSICIALVDGKIPYEPSGSKTYSEGKTLRETLLIETDELKALDKFEDIPTSYVAYPPVSPVGRV